MTTISKMLRRGHYLNRLAAIGRMWAEDACGWAPMTVGAPMDSEFLLEVSSMLSVPSF